MNATTHPATRTRLKAVVALALMVAAFATAYAWRPTKHLADTRAKMDLETVFPKAFGDWRIDDRQPVQLVSPDQLAMINRIYNQTLSRTYVNARGVRIMLSVAYGGDQSDAARAHRPEVCYPAQGFEINANQVASLVLPSRVLPVRQLMARQGGRLEPITYWMVVGERTALSGTQQKLAQLTYSTRGLVPDGMLVRVSSIDADKDKAYTAHAGFVSQLSQAVAPGQAARVFGAAGD